MKVSLPTQNVSSPHAFFDAGKSLLKNSAVLLEYTCLGFHLGVNLLVSGVGFSAVPRPYGSGFLLLRPAVFFINSSQFLALLTCALYHVFALFPSSRGAALHRIPLSLPAVFRQGLVCLLSLFAARLIRFLRFLAAGLVRFFGFPAAGFLGLFF